MFQAQFESKLNQSNLHIYLDKPYEEDYQIPMLQKNPIVGILPVKGAALNGRSKYTYQTKGFQTMAVIYEKKPIQQQEIQLLVMELLQIIEKLENYMLNPNCLILDPEYIFLNEKQWYFCYLPGWDGKLSQSFHQLTEYFVRTLDYGDTNGIVLAYELHKATLQENYNLGEIMKQYEAHEEERKRTMEEWREEQRQNRNHLMFGEKAEGVQMRIAEDYGKDSYYKSKFGIDYARLKDKNITEKDIVKSLVINNELEKFTKAKNIFKDDLFKNQKSLGDYENYYLVARGFGYIDKEINPDEEPSLEEVLYIIYNSIK